MTSIGKEAFFACESLASITIPESVSSIGAAAFNESTKVTVSKENKTFHSNGDCLIETASKTLTHGFKTSIIPDDGSVTSIGACAFLFCESLQSITLPRGITSIGDEAFNRCLSLESIDIPDSVTNIGIAAFGYCTSLKNITIPDSVTNIGKAAFCECTSLKNIIIPASVTSLSGATFDPNHKVVISRENTSFHSDGDCLIETATRTLIHGFNTSTIPDDGSVTIIGDWAFNDCRSLTSIKIPEGVTSIGEFIFNGCYNLTSVTIPNSVTNIADRAFGFYSNITIYAIAGSYAEQYAKEKGINIKLL